MQVRLASRPLHREEPTPLPLGLVSNARHADLLLRSRSGGSLACTNLETPAQTELAFTSASFTAD